MKQQKEFKFESLNLFLSAQKGVHMQGDEEEVDHVTASSMSDNVRGEVRRVVINVLMRRRERMCVC